MLRTHCWRHKCFPVCPLAQHLLRTQILCPEHKKCFGFCSETLCVRSKCFPVCATQETSWATMCPQNVSSFARALRPWQTRTHCCGHIVADTNVSPFARACNICCGHKFCDFVQKHFVSAANVSQFAQPKKHHGQQCVRNNVSSFTRALKSCPRRSREQL